MPLWLERLENDGDGLEDRELHDGPEDRTDGAGDVNDGARGAEKRELDEPAGELLRLAEGLWDRAFEEKERWPPLPPREDRSAAKTTVAGTSAIARATIHHRPHPARI